MTGRKETNPDGESAKGLTPQQAAAVDLLALGTTVTKTAESVGVARQTVSEWMNRNWEFKAALNARRLEIWQELKERLRSLVPKAVAVLDQSLDGEGKSAFDAAVHVLKACGLYGLTAPGGYTEAEDFEIAEREAAGERRRRLMFSEI